MLCVFWVFVGEPVPPCHSYQATKKLVQMGAEVKTIYLILLSTEQQKRESIVVLVDYINIYTPKSQQLFYFFEKIFAVPCVRLWGTVLVFCPPPKDKPALPGFLVPRNKNFVFTK